MKKVLSTIALAAIIASCGQKGYEINGNAEGIEEGTTVYLNTIDPATNAAIAIDSTTVKSNVFVLKGENVSVDENFITFKDVEGRTTIFLEPGVITFSYSITAPETSKATGTKYNDQLSDFNDKSAVLTKKIMSYRADNQEAFAKAQQEGDQNTMEEIMKNFNDLNKEYGEFTNNYFEQNPQSVATLLTYKQYVTQGYDDKEALTEIYDNAGADLQKSAIGVKFKTQIDALKDPKIKIGDKAPDFTANTPEGTTLALKDAMGKLTLIDFWASWCGPCRIENPNVVALYNEFHDKGLNIIGVSLDKDHKNWVDAIEKDQLNWFQVSNLEYFNDPIAKEYEINAIPATYLIDQNGIVVAKNLRGEKLKKKVAELLK